MGTIASQITILTIVYSMVYSGADQRKHQSSVSLAFVGGIHRWQYAGIDNNMMENDLLWQGFKIHIYWASVFRIGLGPRDYLFTTEAFVRSLGVLPQIAKFIGQHGAHLGPVGPRWAPCWPHKTCYQGDYY